MIWDQIYRKRLDVPMFGSNGSPIGNGIWRIEWSRDRRRHMAVKDQDFCYRGWAKHNETNISDGWTIEHADISIWKVEKVGGK